MRSLIKKILKESEEFDWAEEIVDDVINRKLVIVTDTGGNYSHYLYAMYKTGIPEAVKCVQENIYEIYGHDGEDISQLPLYGIPNINRAHNQCFNSLRNKVLSSPELGDICRIIGVPWRRIYALRRESDGKYFIMDKDCFEPYEQPNTITESEDDFEWTTDIISNLSQIKLGEKVEVINSGSYYPTHTEAMLVLNVPGTKEFIDDYGEEWDEALGVSNNMEDYLTDKIPSLGRPKKGDICYIIGEPYNYNIYHLYRLSDGKHFIMDRKGFKEI